MTGTLHEDLRTFVTVSRLIVLRMKNLLDKSRREHQHTFYVQ
jgi:hypothetical protein